jgi:hypothetical protein
MCTREAARTGEATLDLAAAPCAIQTPFAEVLAVIRQDAVVAFAQPPARACHDFATNEAWPNMSDPDAAAAREVFERNFFHRSVAQSVAARGDKMPPLMRRSCRRGDLNSQ